MATEPTAAREAAEEAMGFVREVEQEFGWREGGDCQSFWRELLRMIEQEITEK